MRRLALALALAPFVAAAAPAPHDISAVRDRLRVYTDGKGHFLVTIPFAGYDDQVHTFYGDGRTFYRQLVGKHNPPDDGTFHVDMYDPRLSEESLGWLRFRFDGQRYELACDARRTELQPVPDGDARGILARAAFHERRFEWVPYALARDDDGVYYYVDRSAGGARGFRFFRGRRGSLKQEKLRDAISDDGGDLFFVKTGKLMVKHFVPEAVWVPARTKQPLKLVYLSVRAGDHRVLVHQELGVYDGVRYGTPCDDL